jgi:L-threonylcarbamoyladenylate synthase
MTSKPNPGIEPTGDIARAVERLRVGEPVVIPTETVYGVACDARSETAVQRVFALKGRPETNPLPVLVANIADARSLASHWPDAAQRLSDAFWPGPLTIVLVRQMELAPSVTAGRDTVALRCPDHPIALALAEAFGGPLALTSANRSGAAPATTADNVRTFLDEARSPDVLVLDAGSCAVGRPSTVIRIDPATEDIEILRAGALTEDDILNALQ